MIALRALAPFARRVELAPRCELCASPIADDHGHVVEIGAPGVLCTCLPCAILFARDDSAARYRTVPDRVRVDAQLAVTAQQWTELVPVALAFCIKDSARGQVRICYPGPAGIVDAELAEPVWAALAAATPLARELADDVEALLVRVERGALHARCYLVPVTAAFSLVGRLRATWQGFAGGDEAHRELATFFAELDRQGDKR